MIFENKIGKDFENLPQRLIYNYAVQFAPLRIITVIDEESQKQLYDFIIDFCKLIYNDPSIIGMDRALPDECEDRPLNGRPYLETRKLMRSQGKKLDNTFDLLVLCGNLGSFQDGTWFVPQKEAKLNKPKLSLLSNIGIHSENVNEAVAFSCPAYSQIWPALSYLAELCTAEKNNFFLSRCLFDTYYVYHSEIYSEICGTPDTYGEIHVFIRANDFEFTHTYNDEFKYFAVKSVGGMTINFDCCYDGRYYNQLLFTFVQDKNVYKTVLPRFSELDEETQMMFMYCIKKCNGCRGCCKMNPNGKLWNIPARYKDDDFSFCYVFQFIRTHSLLDRDKIDIVIRFYRKLLNDELFVNPVK